MMISLICLAADAGYQNENRQKRLLLLYQAY